MKERYRIGEVEEILGIPRSTIQYYIKKGLLKIDKDISNGYRYYSPRDMREILHLIVGRSNLQLNLEESVQRTEAKDLNDFRRIFYQQEDQLTQRIRKDLRSIELLHIYYRMLNRIERYMDRYTILEQDKIYLFPEEYIFRAHTSIIDTGFVTSIFQIQNHTAVFQKACSLVFEEDRFLLAEEDLKKEETTIPKQKYLYTVIKTTKEIEDPSIIEPALHHAEKEKILLADQGYLCNEEQGENTFYYDLYLPIRS